MHKYIIILSLLVGYIGLAGCDDMFNLYPQDELLEKDFWQTKDDVESSVINCYYHLRRCQDEMIIYGVSRSDLVRSSGFEDLNNAKKGVFVSKYNICKWNRWYALIQAANLVIGNAERVLGQDPAYTTEVHNQLVGEAKFMRAFAYFNLIRMWKNVPVVDQPSIHDSQDYLPQKSNNPDEVLNFIEDDLQFATTHMVIAYDHELKEMSDLMNRARATRGAAWALYSDVHLWRNNYAECIEACDQVLNSSLYELVDGGNWFDLFHPQKGNTVEAIFELNYDDMYDFSKRQQASRYGSTAMEQWFTNRIYARTDLTVMWPFPDVRYSTLMGTGGNRVRKHAGADASGTNTVPQTMNPNWIIYRLPHVMFNKMEALNRLEGDQALSTINNMLLTIERRAGVNTFEPLSGGVVQVEEQIMYYKLKELAFEGTRWFDLVRIGKRQWDENITGESNFLIREVLKAFNESDKVFVRGNLNNPEAWYLPIHRDELLSNSNLTQNPYYKNI